MNIKTFVFFDSETTGLPFHEYNKTRITELCLAAVQSDHIQLGVFPRIQNKINLCFNPRKIISPEATKITGLSNELLEFQSDFNSKTFDIMQDFLSLLVHPVCFVAHNGNRFDYPILRAELNKTGKDLADDVLCIDTLLAFREMHHQDMAQLKTPEKQQNVPLEFQDGFDELLCSLADELETNGSSKKLSVEEIQKLNETTPIKQKTQTVIKTTNGNSCNVKNGTGPVKKNLRFGQPSFRLGEVYKRLTCKDPVDSHKAECDVNMLIECAAVLGERFVDWSNVNARKLCDIPMMKPGKAISN